MADDDMIVRLAGKQRKRFIASVLGAAEGAPWWGRLNPGEQRMFRQKILDSAGTYHDFMLDVIGVSKDGTLRNEYALELIQAVHDSQRRLERELAQVPAS